MYYLIDLYQQTRTPLGSRMDVLIHWRFHLYHDWSSIFTPLLNFRDLNITGRLSTVAGTCTPQRLTLLGCGGFRSWIKLGAVRTFVPGQRKSASLMACHIFPGACPIDARPSSVQSRRCLVQNELAAKHTAVRSPCSICGSRRKPLTLTSRTNCWALPR